MSSVALVGDGLDVELSDLDDNGTLDALVSGQGGLTVIRGNGVGSGDGTFSLWYNDAARAFADLELADVDADGLEDLIGVDDFQGGRNTVVAISAPSGGVPLFTTNATIAGLGTERSRSADLNADGAFDVIRASALTNPNMQISPGLVRNGVSFAPVAAPLTLASQAPARDAVLTDLNGNGVADLVFSFATGNPWTTRLGQWFGHVAKSAPYAPSGSVGARGIELFGTTAGSINARFTSSTARPQLGAMYPATEEQPWQRDPKGFMPYTAPYRVLGDEAMSRVLLMRGDGTEEERLRIDSRFGARVAAASKVNLERQGLSLAVSGANRGMVVTLPIIAGKWASSPSQIRVFRSYETYMRASSWAADPFAASAYNMPGETLTSSHFLPCRVSAGRCTRNIFRKQTTAEEIFADADANFATGVGARFYVSGTRVVVITDRPGVFQAMAR